MIKEALTILADQLNQYIADTVVEIGNVAALDPTADIPFTEKIVLSLVNVAEETALRNGPDFIIDSQNKVRHQNWPVYINLYLLFSCPSKKEEQFYKASLDKLSRVIEFFQGNREFKVGELALPVELEGRVDLMDMLIAMDLHTLNFEQINDLWGSLGGRQFPFVMYKARLLKIEMERSHGEGPAITEIHSFTRQQ